MMLLDANLLIYAINTDAPQHTKAKQWVEETFSGKRGPVAFSWLTLVAFIRISTNPKVLANPFSLDDALKMMLDWLGLPDVSILHPGSAHAQHFEAVCRSANAVGNLATDAHLAALAQEHGCELASCGADFARFTGLRWINPLAQ